MITATAIPEYLIGTIEYVKAQVENSEELDTQTVSLLLKGISHPAVWEGDPGLTRICRTSSVIDFSTGWEPGLYSLSVDFVDTPESPIVSAGYISVRNP